MPEPTSDQPSGACSERRSSLQIIELIDDAAVARLAGWLPAVLQTWARDPELYAVAVHMRGEPSPTVPADAAPAVADLIWRLHCQPKPIATFLSGKPSSGVLAVALAGTHSVALDDTFVFALTDVRSGRLPCGSLLHAMAKLPGSLGVYLTLTGHGLNRTDARRLGLITHCFAVPDALPATLVPAVMLAARVETIIGQLADADPIDPVLDRWHLDRGPSAIAHLQGPIRRIFSAPSLREILSALDAERGPEAAWAHGVAAQLRAAPSETLTLALATLQRVAHLDLREAIIETHAAERSHDAPGASVPSLNLPTRAALQSLRR